MIDDPNQPETTENRDARPSDLLLLPLRLAAASLAISARIFKAVVKELVSSIDPAVGPNRPEAAPKTESDTPVPHSEKRARKSISQQDLGRLDLARIVVLGDGLAAGMGEFKLHEHGQVWSFPAQLAHQLGQELRQPLIETPGLECSLISPEPGIRPADLYQTTVLKDYPPSSPPDNLSTPGFTVQDAVYLIPNTPLISSNDKKQTAANLIFGLPSLLNNSSDEKPKSLLETAIAKKPTFALVELGFSDLMTAALSRNIPSHTALSAISSAYETILRRLKDVGASVVAMSIPSPLRTAAFSTPNAASNVLKVSADFLQRTYNLRPGDYLTVRALVSIANQLLTRRFVPLCESSVLPEEIASELRHCAKYLNEKLAECASRCGCSLFDLAGLYQIISTQGIPLATRVITTQYLGGFFSLTGIYPGATGQAIIANGVIDFLNNLYGSRVQHINLDQVAQIDAVAQYRPPPGKAWSINGLYFPVPNGDCSTEENGARSRSSHDQINYYDEPTIDEKPSTPLRLPPDLNQVLPLTREISYQGDCMRVLDCQDPAVSRFGGSGDLRFDGATLVASHVEGALRIKFAPPRDGQARFEVEFVNGFLKADDAVLASPGFYQFPLLNAQVLQPPGMLGSGAVHLATGHVSDFRLFCIFQNSGLSVLAALNPNAIPQPAIVTFSNEIGNPRVYGSSWAQFRQRPDGKLDFIFHGTAFVPLGPDALYPLPFASADGNHVTLRASGTSLHPTLRLSTVQPAGQRDFDDPSIPANAIREFEVCTMKSSFGDKFRLSHPDLGEAIGRAHLQGRLRVQFGARFGDSIPFHVSFLPPSGSFEDPSLIPLQDIFPSRLTRGLSGHDANLRFPLRVYRLTSAYLLEDPLDIAVGVVHAKSGKVIGDFLHRGLIGQSLIFALFRIESRTPKSSFQFRGPAGFTRGRDGRLRFNLNSAVSIPYPEGFWFPKPDLASGVLVGPDSSLDPYLQLEAVAPPADNAAIAGGERRVIATTNEVFSYQFAIPARSSANDAGSFEYTNHSADDATFTSVFMTSSAVFTADARSDGVSRRVVNFTAVGHWSRDSTERPHFATIEISCSDNDRYVSIQIDGGFLSNVNTQPNTVIPPLQPT